MSGFYKVDPGAWDFGTSSLNLEQEAAYLRLVNAIHKHEGPVPNVDRVLAGLFRCSTRKARLLVEALAAAGKITVQEGHIWNRRARADLEARGLLGKTRAEVGAEGGRKRAENAVKQLRSDRETSTNYHRTELKTGPKDLFSHDQPQANASSREEERREEEGGGAHTRALLGRDGADEGSLGEAGAIDPGSWTDGRLLEEVMAAVGLQGPATPTHWLPPAATVHVGRWRRDLGLEPRCIVDAARASRAQHPEPPRGPKALDGTMQRLAAELAAAPLSPTLNGANHDRPARSTLRQAAGDERFRDLVLAAAAGSTGGDGG